MISSILNAVWFTQRAVVTVVSEDALKEDLFCFEGMHLKLFPLDQYQELTHH